MPEIKQLSEEEAKQVTAILGIDAVGIIAVDKSGDAYGYSLKPSKDGKGEEVNLADHKHVDLGSLLVRTTPHNPRCCMYWCYGGRCSCIWWC
jgi:hypothetical protein